jgi:hypothetical protein
MITARSLGILLLSRFGLPRIWCLKSLEVQHQVARKLPQDVEILIKSEALPFAISSRKIFGVGH